MSDSKLPKVSAFSKQATKRAVIRATVQHPITMYGVGVGLLGLMASFLFGPSFITNAAVYGGLGIGMASWGFNFFFRGDSYAQEYLADLQEKLESSNAELLASLAKQLKDVSKIPGVEEFGTQGGQQFASIQQRFNTLQEILAIKLNEGEITHRRYLGTAEQVYHSVLDNLHQIATGLKSLSSIDLEYIAERLRLLGAKAVKEEADVQEVQTLNARLALREKQLQKINALLTQNELAMTTLDHTATSVAEVATRKGMSNTDIESAMKELERLAKSAGNYSYHLHRQNTGED